MPTKIWRGAARTLWFVSELLAIPSDLVGRLGDWCLRRHYLAKGEVIDRW